MNPFNALAGTDDLRPGPLDRRAVIAASVLLMVVVLFRVPPASLTGIDAACYANIAGDLASRPFLTWADVRWYGDRSFFEHPPLALWLEALWFSGFGVSAAAAVWWARVLAFTLALLVGAMGQRLVPRGGGVASVLGLLSLASFQRESQNPMFELPLAVACAAALLAAESLPRSARAVIAFALCAVAAFWVKGIVALALLVALPWALMRGASWIRVLGALAFTSVLGVVSVLMFEWLRGRLGLPAYFPLYLQDQVLLAFTKGRHSVDPDPFFHVSTLLEWHLTALLALLVIGWRWRSSPMMRPLAALGLLWLVCVTLPFSLAAQKAPWHLNVLMPGTAWLAGAGLLCVPERFYRFVSLLCLSWGTGWGVLEVRSRLHESPRQAAIRALTEVVPPPPGLVVKNCSVISEWPATHLFKFHWKATMVPCGGEAAWRFDGASLIDERAR